MKIRELEARTFLKPLTTLFDVKLIIFRERGFCCQESRNFLVNWKISRNEKARCYIAFIAIPIRN